MKVLHAPYAVALAEDTEIQPDLLVALRSDFTDKDPTGPTLTAWELVDGTYEAAAAVGPDETWHAEGPFLVAITPGDLLD